MINEYSSSDNFEKKQHGTYMLPYDMYGTIIPKYVTSYPMHWHKELEIIYAHSGKCIYNVDFKEYLINEGDILVIPPTSLHSFRQFEQEKFFGTSILMNQNMINNNLIDACSVKYIQPVFNNEIIFPIYIPVNDENNKPLTKIILKARKCHKYKKMAYEMEMKIYFEEFFLYFFKHEYYEKNRLSDSIIRTSEYMKQIIQYIEKHYQDKIQLEDLSSFANISIYHLSHTFKKVVGESPMEYIKQYRLVIAAERLKSTDSPIINIAIDCGFNNISYFNRSFKEKYGMTPKEYRRGI